MKRIEETHKKTGEVRGLKAKHQQSEFEKESSRVGQDDAVDKHRQALALMKEQQRAAIFVSREREVQNKLDLARELKRANEENAIAIAKARQVYCYAKVVI